MGQGWWPVSSRRLCLWYLYSLGPGNGWRYLVIGARIVGLPGGGDDSVGPGPKLLYL